MAKVLSLELIESPVWQHSRTIAAKPTLGSQREAELWEEGNMVHVRFAEGDRRRHQVGAHVVFSPAAYQFYVLDDTEAPKPTGLDGVDAANLAKAAAASQKQSRA